jgi:Na+-translocating ferredoxin:NAD+ oxidoreductase subunit D
MTRMGKIVFGILAGVFTVLIRALSGYTEGVMFSVIFCNALAPIIDTAVLAVKYRVAKK